MVFLSEAPASPNTDDSVNGGSLKYASSIGWESTFLTGLPDVTATEQARKSPMAGDSRDLGSSRAIMGDVTGANAVPIEGAGN